jgi:hypothetical protein
VKMKKPIILFLMVFACCDLVLTGQLITGSGSEEFNSDRGCSIFTLSLDNRILFCGNLDHPNPDGYIRFWPESVTSLKQMNNHG